SAPNFSAKSKGVPALEPAQSVIQDAGGVAAALRFARWATKAQSAGDVDKGQAAGNGRACRHADIEFRRVQKTIRKECQVDAVKAKTKGIGKSRAEGVVLAQRAQMPETFARVTEPGDISANSPARCGFLAKILLHRIVAVNAFLLAQVEIKI